MDKIGIKEIAKMAGVSQTTVLNVLHERKKHVSEKTYQNIKNIIKEYGYVKKIAPELMSGRVKNIAAIVINKTCVAEVDKSTLVENVMTAEEKYYENQGYTMIHGSERIEDVIQFAKKWELERILLVGYEEKEINEIKSKSGVPIIALM